MTKKLRFLTTFNANVALIALDRDPAHADPPLDRATEVLDPIGGK
jgi:hypothetical protein